MPAIIGHQVLNRTISQVETGLKKRVLSGFFWLSSLSFIGQLATWLVSLIVIRLLEPEDYGLMAMATVFIGFLAVINEMGLGTAIVQKKEIHDIEIRSIFGFVIIINVSFVCIIFFSAPLIARFFLQAQLVPLLRLLSLNFILLSFYSVPQSMLIREINFRRKSLIDLIANLASSGVVLTLAFYGFGVWSLAWGMVVMNLIKAILHNCRKSFRFFPAFTLQGMQPVFSFGGYVIGYRILFYFYTQADIIICGRLFGKDLLGIYSVALFLATLLLNKVGPLMSQIGLPAFSRIQADLKKMQTSFLKLVRVMNLVSFPLFIGLAIIADIAIPVLLGSKWTGVALPLLILSLAMPLRFISMLFPPAVTGAGKPEVIAGNMLFAIVIMPVAFIIGSHWGIIGFCFAWVSGFPVLFIIMLKRTFRVLNLPLSALLHTTYLPILGTIVMAFGVITLRYSLAGIFPALQLLGILVTSGIILYSFSIFLFDRNILKEVRSIFSTS